MYKLKTNITNYVIAKYVILIVINRVGYLLIYTVDFFLYTYMY